MEIYTHRTSMPVISMLPMLERWIVVTESMLFLTQLITTMGQLEFMAKVKLLDYMVIVTVDSAYMAFHHLRVCMLMELILVFRLLPIVLLVTVYSHGTRMPVVMQFILLREKTILQAMSVLVLPPLPKNSMSMVALISVVPSPLVPFLQYPIIIES